MTKIILASLSPRRAELLARLGFDFTVVVSGINEQTDAVLEQTAVVLARKKAQKVAECYPLDVVIGADTVVIQNGKVLGKPKDNDHALKMFKALCGKTHEVYTAVCAVCGNNIEERLEVSKVTFGQFDCHKEQILDYIKSGKAADKAGAYGVQDLIGTLVENVDGEIENVVGLPMAATKEVIQKLLNKGE